VLYSYWMWLIDDLSMAISTGYICSCINETSLMILLSNIKWEIQVEKRKISAKEEDYLETFKNIQHRLWRLNRDIITIL
jgi:hypothetical protein